MPRVLVVDDEPFIPTTVSMLVTLEGCEVHTAADGRAGLQAALDNPPDLILSDISMPHMGGALALGQAAQSLEQTAKEQGHLAPWSRRRRCWGSSGFWYVRPRPAPRVRAPRGAAIKKGLQGRPF